MVGKYIRASRTSTFALFCQLFEHSLIDYKVARKNDFSGIEQARNDMKLPSVQFGRERERHDPIHEFGGAVPTPACFRSDRRLGFEYLKRMKDHGSFGLTQVFVSNSAHAPAAVGPFSYRSILHCNNFAMASIEPDTLIELSDSRAGSFEHLNESIAEAEKYSADHNALVVF